MIAERIDAFLLEALELGEKELVGSLAGEKVVNYRGKNKWRRSGVASHRQTKSCD